MFDPNLIQNVKFYRYGGSIWVSRRNSFQTLLEQFSSILIGSRFLRASSAIYTLVYEQALSGKIHEKIWHNVATQRCKQFFWLLYRWRLPTAELLLRRNIVDLSFYSRCGAVEDQEHLLLNCSDARRIWKRLHIQFTKFFGIWQCSTFVII